MLDAIFGTIRASSSVRFLWKSVIPYIASVLDEPSHPSVNRAITLTSPHVPQEVWLDNENRAARWLSAVSTVQYTEEIGQSVVDALLQIAHIDHLRPRIPIDVWAWLKKKPSLAPVCEGRFWGSGRGIACHVRALGDISILKSYFLIVWSEWGLVPDASLNAMGTSIREDFGGVWMMRHREDLIKRLDYVLGQLDLGLELEYFERIEPRFAESYIQEGKEQYGELKKILLQVDERAMKTLARACPS